MILYSVAFVKRNLQKFLKSINFLSFAAAPVLTRPVQGMDIHPTLRKRNLEILLFIYEFTEIVYSICIFILSNCIQGKTA